MFKTRYGNVLTVILVIVVILILGLIGWFVYDTYKQRSANDKAQTAVSDFKKKIKKKTKQGDDSLEVGNVVTTEKIGNEKTYLENYEVKGIIEIPKNGIEYPILSQVTKRSLELAVAILWGPGLNEVGNTVILGHNYRNGLFFSDNGKLSNGDKILITDQSGTTITYIIYKIEERDPDDSDYMLRDTGDYREISLSTCTDDSSARIVIWAREEEKEEETNIESENTNETTQSDDNNLTNEIESDTVESESDDEE